MKKKKMAEKAVKAKQQAEGLAAAQKKVQVGELAVVAKKLKKEALTQYGMYDVEKIKTQVTNGKNAMPAFGEKLAPDDIEDVATYVLSQADKGWA